MVVGSAAESGAGMMGSAVGIGAQALAEFAKADGKIVVMSASGAGEQATLCPLAAVLDSVVERLLRFIENQYSYSDTAEQLRKKIDGMEEGLSNRVAELEKFCSLPAAMDLGRGEISKVADSGLQRHLDQICAAVRDVTSRTEQMEQSCKDQAAKLESVANETTADLEVLYAASMEVFAEGAEDPASLHRDLCTKDSKMQVLRAHQSMTLGRRHRAQRQAQAQLEELVKRCDEVRSQQTTDAAASSHKIQDLDRELALLRQQLQPASEEHSAQLQHLQDLALKLQEDVVRQGAEVGKMQEDLAEESIFRDEQHQRGMRRDKEAEERLSNLAYRMKSLEHGFADDCQVRLDELREDVNKVTDVLNALQDKLRNFWMLCQLP
mmetsp:Transcript_49098/g.116878  ORF Transcript_49098/g.116878 Transcript_49098/m.116878 type:complete len:380 (+) Transcript_49098:131-1270(+)